MSSTYIPVSRQDLVDKLCKSDQFSSEDRVKFREFCEILAAYSHFNGQKDLELMKLAFSEFDPNEDTPRRTSEATARAVAAQTFAEAFERTVHQANFVSLPESEVRDALNKASIIPVETSVDFDDFERFAFYFRMSNEIEISIKRWFKEKKITVGNYARMVAFLQVKDQAYFDAKGKTPDRNMRPGLMYLNLYKNIPHHDLELLFPNLKIRMSLKDKLMLGVPAVGAAVPLLLKILPSLGLLIGAIALFVFGWEMSGRFAVGSDGKAIFALLTAALSIALALGGFAAGQYVKYKSRRLEFLKKVADTLFFKSLDVGKGVLNALNDSAEEEQCKEMMLAFYILLTASEPLSVAAIGAVGNRWLRDNLGREVDFEVQKTLQYLEDIRTHNDFGSRVMVTVDKKGRYKCLEIDEAKALIDDIWDSAFRY